MNEFKYILVGDMHVKPDTIEECKSLILWIKSQCMLTGATPIFMGDQFDTHGNVRVEVLEFWTWVYLEVFECRSISLVGNHDMDFSCRYTTMTPFSGVTQVVRGMECVDSQLGLWGIGYVKGSGEFEKAVNELGIAGRRDGVRMLLCHQEFNGAQYESGFYAPGGVNLENVPKSIQFVSGHIHLKQQVGDRVLYVGTPRQLTRADNDYQKCVWTLDNEGKLSPIEVPASVCPRFERHRLEPPFMAIDLNIVNPSKAFVDVYGAPDYIKKAIASLPEGVRVRTFPAREASAKRDVRESEGVNRAFRKYMETFSSEKSLSIDQRTFIESRLKEICPELVNG